jgi:hypothetical protein
MLTRPSLLLTLIYNSICIRDVVSFSYWNFNKLNSQQHLIQRNKVLDSDKHLSPI